MSITGCGSDSAMLTGTVAIVDSTSAKPLSATRTSALSVASDLPVVFNATDSARPGDVITLQGANFGASPEVRLLSSTGGAEVPLPLVNRVGDWVAVRIPTTAAGALALRIVSDGKMSAPVKLNAAKAYHLDSLQIAAGGGFRIFGRNLQLPGSTASVSVNGQLAVVDTARSNEHMLAVTAPASLGGGTTEISVDNGNGSGPATAERSVEVIADATGDPFGTGVGWTGTFTPLMARTIDIACNGDSVSWPIQQAVDSLAASGGGIVQLGAGVCTFDGGVAMRSNIVLQGAGKAATVIRYGGNYPIWAEGLSRIALRNLTLMNKGPVEEGPLLKHNRQVVLQNVAMRFGRTRQSFFTENEGMVVSGCEFVQSESIGEQSPYLFIASKGLIFTDNTTNMVAGAAAFERVSDAYIGSNKFIRDTDAQNQPGALHMMTIDFATRIAVVGNTYMTSGGPITNKTRNDGEALLTEGGGPNRTENLGTVATATASSLTDPTLVLKTDPFGNGIFPANYGVAIVGGTGTGQTRYVTGFANGTLTIDRDWDVVPDNTSKYATFVWGLEKSILKDNVFDQMPRGIWLYQAAIRDVDVVGNRFTEGGGIYLRSYQNLDAKMFDPIYNVRIAGNTVTNRLANWASYVTAVFINADARAFGMAMTNIAIRDNALTAGTPNTSLRNEEYAGEEGYFNMMRVENYSRYEPMAVPRILGTVFQANTCINCAVDYRIGTGAGGTTLLGAISQNSGTLLDNWRTTMAADVATDTVVN